MVRIIVCFIITNVWVWSLGQTSNVIPIPVSALSDTPQEYVNFMYEEHNYSLENSNADYSKLLNNTIRQEFKDITKLYIVVFSNLYTRSTVEEETEKLLKKWDFEHNFPYSYLLVFSNFTPRIVLGKYLNMHASEVKQLESIIEPLYKRNASAYIKLTEIINVLKDLNIPKKNIPTQNYMAQWDKYYFFNYSKAIAEKEAKYLDILLEQTYHTHHIRFWIIADTNSKNTLNELSQKADFNTHTNQVIIAFNTRVFDIDVLLTRDLRANWNNAVENQIKTTAQFYHEKGWYYDMIKESFLMLREQLLYKTITTKIEEDASILTAIQDQNMLSEVTLALHKGLFWVIAMLLLIPLMMSKKYIEKIYAGQDPYKIRSMKSTLAMGYLSVLFCLGLWIAYYTPLFYASKPIEPFRFIGFFCVVLDCIILIQLFKRKIINYRPNAMRLFFLTFFVYFISMSLNYAVFASEEFYAIAFSSAQADFSGIFITFLFYLLLMGGSKNKSNINMEASIRKGFGKRKYVSKYQPIKI